MDDARTPPTPRPQSATRGEAGEQALYRFAAAFELSTAAEPSEARGIRAGLRVPERLPATAVTALWWASRAAGRR